MISPAFENEKNAHASAYGIKQSRVQKTIINCIYFIILSSFCF